jgi:hypothetical protein
MAIHMKEEEEEERGGKWQSYKRRAPAEAGGSEREREEGI